MMRMTNGNAVWNEFCNKMRRDELSRDDFTDEMQMLLYSLLCGTAAAQRRNKFISSSYEVYETSEKISIVVRCADDEYRFDFIRSETKWKLAFVECITLPISNIKSLPYESFTELSDKETSIRREKEISRLIFMYHKFKELLGQEQAVKMFLDGKGEYICARSWVPFYSERLSYIAYAAWIENRINGEKIFIEKFDESVCCLKFSQHIWRKMYAMTGHLQNMIEYDEYMYLFEEIWRDRANASGWRVEFEYSQEDTVLIFKKDIY